MSNGFIPLWRKVFDNDYLNEKPYNRGWAWSYLVSRAQHEPKRQFFNGEAWELQRGELVTSVRHLARQFGWNRKKVTAFLRTLDGLKMTSQRGTPKGTVISILKYNDYQIKGTSTNFTGTVKGTVRGTGRGRGGVQGGATSNKIEDIREEESNTPLPPSKGGGRKGNWIGERKQRKRDKVKEMVEAARKWEAENMKGGDSNAKN